MTGIGRDDLGTLGLGLVVVCGGAGWCGVDAAVVVDGVSVGVGVVVLVVVLVENVEALAGDCGEGAGGINGGRVAVAVAIGVALTVADGSVVGHAVAISAVVGGVGVGAEVEIAGAGDIDDAGGVIAVAAGGVSVDDVGSRRTVQRRGAGRWRLW